MWTASSASAQNYSFDARRIALGGAGGTPNLASKMVERQRRYRSILIPVGLVRLLSNIRVFYPNREDFDFSRAVEYAYSPLHQVFGRREDMTAKSFFRDIVRAQLEPDLNAYSGFSIDPSITAEGLILENWGKTFMLRSDDRSFQGIYVGAGPYLAAARIAEFDSQLVSLLNGQGDTYVPDASLDIGGGETDQLALAMTGGYRARFPLFSQEGTAAGRNGMYVAANFHYLRVSASTPSTRTFNSTPTRSASFSQSADGALRARLAHVVEGTRHGPRCWRRVRRQSLGFRLRRGWHREPDHWSDIERHHVSLLSFFGGTEFVHVRLPTTERSVDSSCR